MPLEHKLREWIERASVVQENLNVIIPCVLCYVMLTALLWKSGVGGLLRWCLFFVLSLVPLALLEVAFFGGLMGVGGLGEGLSVLGRTGNRPSPHGWLFLLLVVFVVYYVAYWLIAKVVLQVIFRPLCGIAPRKGTAVRSVGNLFYLLQTLWVVVAVLLTKREGAPPGTLIPVLIVFCGVNFMLVPHVTKELEQIHPPWKV